jgi:ribonucleoside-diphosphate reductase alpha chain
MTARERLSNRRGHELVTFDHGGFRYSAGIGRFSNGELAEIFLNVAKSGTALENTARDAAIVVSLALQYGASAATIRHALTRNADGSASGPLGALLDLLEHTTEKWS